MIRDGLRLDDSILFSLNNLIYTRNVTSFHHTSDKGSHQQMQVMLIGTGL